MDFDKEFSSKSGYALGVLADFLTVLVLGVAAESSLARRARRALRREAVFFLRKPFLAALSYSL